MKTVGDVFDAAMALMDELSTTGAPRTTDTKEYEYRTPGIVNMMIGEKRILSGEHGALITVESMDDDLIGIEDNYALAVMNYGLAANLLVDENPTAAAFYEQRYEELRDRFMARQAPAYGEIENLYGGIEYGEFSRW